MDNVQLGYTCRILWRIPLDIKSLLSLATEKQSTKRSISQYKERLIKREASFTSNSKKHAATEKFLARSYTL